MKADVYKELLDKMNVIAMITDDHERIQYVNQAFKDETGYGEEIIGNKPDILHSGKHSLMFYNNLKHTLQAGLDWSGIFKNKKKDGSFFQEDAYIFPLECEGKHYYAKVATNATKIEEMVTENKQALHLAKAIQRSLIAEDTFEEGISIRTKYLPLESVSGDIYNYYKINDHIYTVFLADIVGHGIGSSLLSTSIMAIANDVVKYHYMPNEFLQTLNRKIMGLFNTNELPQTSYFTAAYVVVDLKSKLIHYANCGHPKMYLMRKNGIDELLKPNFFLGMFQNAEYEYDTYNYDAPCRLLMYSDGLSEMSVDGVAENMLYDVIKVYSNLGLKGSLADFLEDKMIKTYKNMIKDDISIIDIELL